MERSALLEVGVEDFPPSFVKLALIQFKEKGKELFLRYRLKFKSLQVGGSSRRLILLVEGVPDKQEDLVEREKGPPAKVLFSPQGKLTSQGEGYLRAKGLKREDLKVERDEKGEYVWVEKRTKGEKTPQVLKRLFPELLFGLEFPKTMRWGKESFFFPRPLRYVLALWGDTPVEFEVGGVRSDRESESHPYLYPGEKIKVKKAEEYLEFLKKRGVIWDQEERKKIILREIEKILTTPPGARMVKDEELLETLSLMVEHPKVFMGNFSPSFLSLPFPLLRACLRDYQFHFSVVKESGEPLPVFLGIRDGGEENMKEVREGNERVLEARLRDAEFFFQEDKKIPLEKRVEELKEIVVQEKMGSYLEKTRRLVKLTRRVWEELGGKEGEEKILERASYLCKADLLTQVVKEFPELAGEMGSIYAREWGEGEEVARAICEHRRPLFPGDSPPETSKGAVLALSDRIDTLVGSIWAGFIPTGSQDPWGLRRDVQAIIDILSQKDWRISLEWLIRESLKTYRVKGKEGEKVLKVIRELFLSRLRGRLKEMGLSGTQIEAVLGAGFDDLAHTLKRGRVLLELSRGENFREEVIALVRVVSILRQAEEKKISFPREVKEKLLKEKEEKLLFEKWRNFKEKGERLWKRGEYVQAFRVAIGIREYIHLFFDRILVMCEEEALRLNRLALLGEIGSFFQRLADFTLLQVK